MRFNRYIVECKWLLQHRTDISRLSFNRYIVECKLLINTHSVKKI